MKARILALLATLLVIAVPKPAVAGESQRVIVTFADAKSAARATTTDAAEDADMVGKRALVLEAAPSALAAVRKLPGAVAVEPDRRLRATVLPNDPCVRSCSRTSQWHLPKVRADVAWNSSRGAGVTVAVLDTGVDASHPDLASKLVGPEVDVTGLGDGPGTHGTAAAGLAAAVTNNGRGVAGVGWDSRILSVKVMDHDGSGYTSWVSSGIYTATDRGAKVISLSLGGPSSSRALADAVSYATSRGVTVVAAAGNEATTNLTYPAALSGVVAVAASTSSDQLASFSNRGSWVDLAAPGVDLVTTATGGSYTRFSGTSAATPVVAGAAALLVAQAPTRSPADIAARLTGSVAGLAGGHGFGRLDAGAAVSAPTPATTPASPAGAPPASSPASPATAASIQPYGGFGGGARVAQADVDGDGRAEIITGPGAGGGPHVRAFRADGTPLGNGFFAYNTAFSGGVDVAAGDVDGDGRAEIVTGPGAGGGPHVRVFRADGTPLGNGFFAYNTAFSGGVQVATADVDGDGRVEIVTGPGAGGGPHVRVFRADGTPLGNGFFAYATAFSAGVDVSAADLDADGKAEIVTGPGAGGGPHVRVFRADGTPLGNGFFAYATSFSGGVRVSSADLDGDRRAEIVTGPGAGGGPHVRVFRADATPLADRFPFPPSFPGGTDVAAWTGTSAVSTLTRSSEVRLVALP